MSARQRSHRVGLVALATTSALLVPMAGLAAAPDPSAPPLSVPIDAKVVTTVDRTVVPDAAPAASPAIYPYQVAEYGAKGYGTWTFGPGAPVMQRLDLVAGEARDAAASAVPVARLADFFTFSDVHITDEESPAGAIALGWKGGIPSGYSAVMMLTTQVLDAAVQTVNALHAQRPIDFGLLLGDAANDSEHVEARWYIDTLDGGIIVPDTGIKDDPVAGPGNDYQDPFMARGLDPAIPWYQVIGNHDHNWMGSGPVDDHILASYVGDAILDLGDPFLDPMGIKSRGTYMGTIDGSTPDGDVYGAGPVTDFTTPPKAVAADPARAPMTSVREWMRQYFTTTSQPVGHGFTQANLDSGSASYTIDPLSDVPVTIIGLDDTQPNSDRDTGGNGHGYLDLERYGWLVDQLDRGQAAGRLMLIAAHVPIGVEPPGSPMGWSPSSEVSLDELIDTLHRYPNLVAWLAGHRHGNTLTAFPSPDPDRPELGFWEVETSSLRDFPQMLRTFSLQRRSDGTIALATIDVDPAVAEGSLAALSRSYGVATHQLFDLKTNGEPTGVFNAELVKPLSPAMQAALQGAGEPMSGE
jgi:metallophosphoesterase (TIGR03768 family)